MNDLKSTLEISNISFVSFEDKRDIIVMQEPQQKNEWTIYKLISLVIVFGMLVIASSIIITPWLILILPVAIITASITLLVYIHKTFNSLLIEYPPATTSNNSITMNVIEDEHDGI